MHVVRKFLILVLAFALTSLALPAPSAVSAPTVTRISIVTGGTGGVYFVMGGGLARLISQHVPGVQATAEVTSASVDNMKLIGAKRAEIAFTQNDTALDAFRGVHDFRGQPIPIRTLVPIYDNYVHLVTFDGLGINSVADLRGKRVSVGSPGSGTELAALRILRAGGLDPERDVRRERLGVGPSADALRDRRIDAFFWNGGLPTPAVLDLASAPSVRVKIVPLQHVVDAMRREYGDVYYAAPISRVVYPGMDQNVPTIAQANLLVVHGDFPADLAYQITRLVFDRKADLRAVHAEADTIQLTRIAGRTPVTFHPGAARFFAERHVRGF